MSFITLQPWVMELWSYDRTQDASAGCFFSKITKEEVSLEMKNVPELQLLKDFQARIRSSDAVAVTHRIDWWAIRQKLFGFNLEIVKQQAPHTRLQPPWWLTVAVWICPSVLHFQDKERPGVDRGDSQEVEVAQGELGRQVYWTSASLWDAPGARYWTQPQFLQPAGRHPTIRIIKLQWKV